MRSVPFYPGIWLRSGSYPFKERANRGGHDIRQLTDALQIGLVRNQVTMKKPKQLALKLPFWGGKRRRAGRKPNGAKAGVAHEPRPWSSRHHPVHVTMRAGHGVGYLRGYRLFKAIERALRQAKARFGVRIAHFSVQGNHLHLLIEADSAEALRRAMQGLAIRIAKAVNRALRRSGKVFADRFHSRQLATKQEVVNALKYVLENFRHHLRPDVAPSGADPCSSAAWLRVPVTRNAPVVAPQTWLLRHVRDGWSP